MAALPTKAQSTSSFLDPKSLRAAGRFSGSASTTKLYTNYAVRADPPRMKCSTRDTIANTSKM
jgi:hypothetical protein